MTTTQIPRTTIELVRRRAEQIHRRETGGPAGRHTAAERVALELVDAILTPGPFARRVPDELYERAAALYDYRALWTLTLAIAGAGWP
jgi:hypothetical protein